MVPRNWARVLLLFRLCLGGPLPEGYSHGQPHRPFSAENALTEERLNQIRQRNEVATQRGQTLAQMALRWILRDGIATGVPAGASRPEQVLDNIKAAENTQFTPRRAGSDRPD